MVCAGWQRINAVSTTPKAKGEKGNSSSLLELELGQGQMWLQGGCLQRLRSALSALSLTTNFNDRDQIRHVG